jgi:hypothetical protein
LESTTVALAASHKPRNDGRLLASCGNGALGPPKRRRRKPSGGGRTGPAVAGTRAMLLASLIHGDAETPK